MQYLIYSDKSIKKQINFIVFVCLFVFALSCIVFVFVLRSISLFRLALLLLLFFAKYHNHYEHHYHFYHLIITVIIVLIITVINTLRYGFTIVVVFLKNAYLSLAIMMLLVSHCFVCEIMLYFLSYFKAKINPYHFIFNLWL